MSILSVVELIGFGLQRFEPLSLVAARGLPLRVTAQAVRIPTIVATGAIAIAEDNEKEEVAVEEEALTPEVRAHRLNKLRIQGYDQRLDAITLNIKELSKNIAKKLSTMIDLMVSLSAQVSKQVVPRSDIILPPWATAPP